MKKGQTDSSTTNPPIKTNPSLTNPSLAVMVEGHTSQSHLCKVRMQPDEMSGMTLILMMWVEP